MRANPMSHIYNSMFLLFKIFCFNSDSNYPSRQITAYNLMYVTGSVGVISTKSLKIYRVSWNAIHMPSIPPAQLPSSEVSENASAPSKPDKYPPATEPIIIPIIIMVFRDIFVAVIVTHLGKVWAYSQMSTCHQRFLNPLNQKISNNYIVYFSLY